MSRAPTRTAPNPPALLRHSRANRELQLGGHLVAYELLRASRRSIGLRVSGDGLAVSAPSWIQQHEIDTALQIKASWILRKLAEQAERQQQQAAARPVWQHGMELPYLGEVLRIECVPALPGASQLTRHDTPAVLQLRLAPGAEAAQIRTVVQGWLQHQARALFADRCRHFAARMNVPVRRVALSAARTRWGSASSSGSVRLNWRLIHYPLATIDYVVVHELAHLREMNHSPAFWAIVRAVLPDFELQRDTLKDGVAMGLD